MNKLRTFSLEYAGIHATYWMYFGVINSFSSVFLLAKGFSNSEIGVILALGNIISVAIQPFVADAADKKGGCAVFHMMLGMTGLLAVLTVWLRFSPAHSFLQAALYTLAIADTMTIQPFCNAASSTFEQTGIVINFGLCRSAGSLAYALLMMSLGTLVELKGVNSLAAVGLITAGLFALVIARSSHDFARGMAETKSAAAGKAENGGVQASVAGAHDEIDLKAFVKRHKMFVIVCIGVMFVYFSNSIINNFLAQIVLSVGGDSEDTGRIFSLLAFTEIPTLILFNRINHRFRCTTLLKFSSIAFIAWIGMCVIAENVLTVYLAQFVQPFAFALFLPSMVRFIDDTMSRGEAVKGHTFFTGTTIAASIFTTLAGGFILDASGARALAITGTAVTTLGALIIILTIDKAKLETGSEARNLRA
ncbi:MAG: MFS transporter [Eubacterium sp.]|jgi:PPP family 3-phenylpropionic acid transporter